MTTFLHKPCYRQQDVQWPYPPLRLLAPATLIRSAFSVFFLLVVVRAVGQYPFRNPALSIEERLENLRSLMTLEEKIDLLAGYNDFFIHPVERLGIPPFIMADGPLGLASWGIHGRGIVSKPNALTMLARSDLNSLSRVWGTFLNPMTKTSEAFSPLKLIL